MFTAKGVILRLSPYSVKETIDHLQAYLQENNVTIYARINQRVEAEKVGLQIPPLELLLFGNPKAGIPVMTENPLTALDLPIKVIAFEDNQNSVWLAYNEDDYLADRYALSQSQSSPLMLNDLMERLFQNTPWGEETDVSD